MRETARGGRDVRTPLLDRAGGKEREPFTAGHPVIEVAGARGVSLPKTLDEKTLRESIGGITSRTARAAT